MSGSNGDFSSRAFSPGRNYYNFNLHSLFEPYCCSRTFELRYYRRLENWVKIEYCRTDVGATLRLLNAVLAEFKQYPVVNLPPEKAYSAASIAKATLATMGVTLPRIKFPLDDNILGICMQAYYGGRAEVRIRHTSVPVVYVDFLSQYPTVNILLALWPMLIAEEIRVREATEEIRNFVEGLTLHQLLDPTTWPNLRFFALVQPQGDILPVRTVYGDQSHGDQTNIGLNPLTSGKPIWFAGPDIAASLLLSGKQPTILRALRFEPVGVQKGMKSVTLGSGVIDPYRDDFFRKIIEERKEKKKTDPLYYFLKILANAGCYGIYAEVNKVQVGKNNPKKLGVFSGEESGAQRTCVLEPPGPWYFPPIAALTTAGGRLLLAMLERMVADAGGSNLMCDTDSMAIIATEQEQLVACNGGSYRTTDGKEAIKALSREHVIRIVDSFKTLNPYKMPGSILNVVEEINYDSAGHPRQLHGYGYSAKRYSLYTQDESGLQIIKASEHGLGLYYRPIEGRDPECDAPLWIKEGWEWLLRGALGHLAKSRTGSNFQLCEGLPSARLTLWRRCGN